MVYLLLTAPQIVQKEHFHTGIIILRLNAILDTYVPILICYICINIHDIGKVFFLARMLIQIYFQLP